MRQYGKAVKLYQEILDNPPEEAAEEQLTAQVWNNLGACYGRMFLFDKAAEAFEKAYNRSGSRDCLRSLYWIEKLDSRVTLGERFHAAITQEEQETWDAQLSAAREKAAQSDLVRQVETWFGDGAEDGEKALEVYEKNKNQKNCYSSTCFCSHGFYSSAICRLWIY